MCGIVGYAGVSGVMQKSQLFKMRDSMLHRGPDGAGFWCSSDGRAVFGHRRLAILDLTSAGAQPMTTNDGYIGIIFNGEIYNHAELRRELEKNGISFIGRSDTEVLLASYKVWGNHFVKRLRGMFAFAIYDQLQRILFIARDRAGEKPLFWTQYKGGILFASEVKALLADNEIRPELSPEGLDFYLAYGYVPSGYCILKGIHKLSPAHSLTWSLETQKVTLERYWDVPNPKPVAPDMQSTLLEELESLLVASVKEQMVADVPVSILLSGGVDSSLITAIAASISDRPVRTYTVSVAGNAHFDEGPFGRCIAKYFSTEHVELQVNSASVDLIPALARQYDEPIADSSLIPTYLLAREVSHDCKVVLGGDGGDELFGGYNAYQGGLMSDRLRKLLPQFTRTMLSWSAQHLLPERFPRRNGLIGLSGGLEDMVAQSTIIFDYAYRSRLSPWLASQRIGDIPKNWRRSTVEPERGVPGAMMVTDFRTYLPDDILVKVDRASMLCSLEVRAPFLDHRIVEFAYSHVPNDLRTSISERKILLKALARRLLPLDYDIDRKQGFSIPLSHWIGPKTINQWLEECSNQIHAIFSDNQIKFMTKNNNNANNEYFCYRIFYLMMLTWWMRHYGVTI